MSEAYDASEPGVELVDLFAAAGWYSTGDAPDDINARIWRRDSERRTVLLNSPGEKRSAQGMAGKDQHVKR